MFMFKLYNIFLQIKVHYRHTLKPCYPPVNSMLSCLPLPLREDSFVTHRICLCNCRPKEKKAMVCHGGCHAGFHSNPWLYQLISLIREGERRETNHWNQLGGMKTSTLAAFSGTWSHIIVMKCEAGFKNAHHTLQVLIYCIVCVVTTYF